MFCSTLKMGGNSNFQKLKNGGRVNKTCIFELYYINILDCYISKESIGTRVSVYQNKINQKWGAWTAILAVFKSCSQE